MRLRLRRPADASSVVATLRNGSRELTLSVSPTKLEVHSTLGAPFDGERVGTFADDVVIELGGDGSACTDVCQHLELPEGFAIASVLFKDTSANGSHHGLRVQNVDFFNR